MRTKPNPFSTIYLLIESDLPLEKTIPLIIDAIDNEILIRANDDNQLFLSTQSRLQYLFSIDKISKELFQKITQLKIQWNILEHSLVFNSSIAILTQLISSASNDHIPDDLKSYTYSIPISFDEATSSTQFLKSSRISLIKYNETSNQIDFVFEKETQEIHCLSLSEMPERKRKILLQSLKYLKPPFDIYAHKLFKTNESWQAEEFIILPDFLVDVTAIASCYNNQGANPLKHLIHLYYYNPAAFSALVGTSINQFLDEMILTPGLSFDELSRNLFQHNPIAFSLLTDSEVLKYYETIKTHFYNIQGIVDSKFHQLVDQLENCLMEPSFYSVEYGIQGRLDVFYENKKTLQKLIIELKSGKPYLSNRFGINADHHAQIMLYYLLIQSVYGSYQQVDSKVLYSSQSENALRSAPVIEDMKQELIHLRNSIILLHLHLAYRNPADPFILDLVTEKSYSLTESYTKRDAGIVLNVYARLAQIEKDYFKELSGFISREQFISKMGRSNTQYTEGLASLWLLSEHEKINNFMILHDLIIHEIILEPGEYPILILRQTSKDEYISNFRTGDTLVLYSGPSALKEQIYKCTLIEQFPNEYRIRLRTRQFPNIETSKLKSWNLEHDSMDRSFVNQFQGLTDFSLADAEKRQKIMGTLSPTLNQVHDSIDLNEVPEHIHETIKKIVQSQDYFLLWGPPGSGKTSLVIKHLTRILLANKEENILLLAYTNRAVDEICEAIESIDVNQVTDYIRIGSRFAVSLRYRKNLLEDKIGSFKNRKQVQQLLKKTRLFTATISSIQGKKELFALKKFETVIIDEASQILESQLVGILHKFKRFILIGDHMQLPAVTAQTEEESKIHSELLLNVGFKSLSMSLFERLLQQCKTRNWDHAFEMLTYQGRMHEELMKFPTEVFYENKLKILPNEPTKRQCKNYSILFSDSINPIHHALGTYRTIFIHCEHSESFASSKTNLLEAKIVSMIIKSLYELYEKNNKKWNDSTLGVVTPFRAQISQIKNQIHQNGLDHIQLTVDTAERYQGSTRDIIILSTVITDEIQLSQISSINTQGIDRKLNVALTRAREQIILIGNKNALTFSPLYRKLIADYWNWNRGWAELVPQKD